MAKTCAEMITRVTAVVGRTQTTSNLPLSGIILDGLNEAMLKIARKLPNVLELQVKNTTSLIAATDTYSYSLAAITPAIAHIQRVWVLNGLQSEQIHFKPKDDFDRLYPDVSAVAAGLPDWYTRRGSALEFSCPFSSDYNALHIRLDYCRWATAFASTASTETSDILNADKGLMLWAEAEAWRALAKGNQTLQRVAEARAEQWKEWLREFEAYHDLQTEDTTREGPRHLYCDEEE